MLKKLILILSSVVTIIAICLIFALCKQSNSFKNIVIMFSKDGNISEYALSGFSAPEPTLTWTIDKEASITIPTPKIPQNHVLKVSAYIAPYLSKKIKKQDVKVFMGDKLIDRWVVDKFDTYTALLPQDINSENIVLRFQISNPKNTKEKDARKLGLAFKSLTLSVENAINRENYSEYKINQEISFGKNGNATDYIGTGWSLPEKDFTWTDGKDAYITMFVKNAVDKKLQLNVFGHAVFAPDDEYQNVTVFVNDTELTQWQVNKGKDRYSVIIPASVVGSGTLKIRFHIDKPVKPGIDIRNLGMAVRTVTMSQFFATKTKIKLALWLKNKVLKNVDNDNTEKEQ